MTPPRPSGSWLASQGRLPLAFMVLGLVWLGISVAATAIWPDLLVTPHIAPAVIALTHTWVLGFFVTIAVGAVYQLAPVALGTTLWSERAAWCHFVIHAAAVPVMIHGFIHWEMPLLAVAGTVLAGGVGIFAVNTLTTIARCGRRDVVAWSLALATVWLVLTVTAGVLLVANRLWNLWAHDPLLLLRAHAHLGLVGFFITLLQGVTFRLVPMFTLGEVPDWRPVRLGLWLSQIGLVVLAPALAWHHGTIALLSGSMIALGLILSAYALKRTLATRKKRQLDFGVAAFARGGVMLLVSAVVGLWLVAPTTRAGSMPGGVSANVYGVVVFVGALLPVIAGMMNKIVPFLTWMRAYGPKVGRMPTPPATTLSHPRLEFWALTIQAIALIPLLLGTWTLQESWLRTGSLLLAVGTGAFLANMIGILRHLWRPVMPASHRPAANTASLLKTASQTAPGNASFPSP